MRDSTFRSIILSCREGRSLFLPALLHDVTTSKKHLKNLYSLLQGNPGYGESIKTLRILDQDTAHLSDVEAAEISLGLISLSPDVGTDVERIARGLSKVNSLIYERTTNLQEVIVRDPRMFFDLAVGCQLIPQAFLSRSLRKLVMSSGWNAHTGQDISLNANNAVWLLSFCPQLTQCSLSISITSESYDYVSEFSETFKGLSNVKHLALNLCFKYDPSKSETWWGLPEEDDKIYQAGTKKTETVYQLLKVTKNLISLELASQNIQSRPEDRSSFHSDCLLGLESSFRTLTHLRLIQIEGSSGGMQSILPRFTALKSLTADARPLSAAARAGDLISETVEVIRLPYYNGSDSLPWNHRFFEDQLLARLISFGCYRTLKLVVIPPEPCGPEAQSYDSANILRRWEDSRKKLLDCEGLKSGECKLVFLHPRDAGESSPAARCFCALAD